MPMPPPSPPGAAIPVPYGLFEVLLLLTFAAHLLAMNAALGGTLLSLFTMSRDRGAALSLGGRLPTTVAVTVNLGVPPLLFASVLYGQFLYTAAILSAAAWLPFFLIVMAAYALLYVARPRLATPGGGMSLLPPALLLLAASGVMVTIATLSIRPGAWTAWSDHTAGTVLNFADPTFFPRWLHFLIASLAVGGLFLALLHRKDAAGGDGRAKELVDLGLAWFSRATLVQMADGVLFLVSLPDPVRRLFLGGSPLHTTVLVLGVGLGLTALALARRGAPGQAAWAVAATVCAMVTVRELLRQATLAPSFSPATLPVAPQYGPFVLFAVSLLAVAGVTVWIIRVWQRSAGGEEA